MFIKDRETTKYISFRTLSGKLWRGVVVVVPSVNTSSEKSTPVDKRSSKCIRYFIGSDWNNYAWVKSARWNFTSTKNFWITRREEPPLLVTISSIIPFKMKPWWMFETYILILYIPVIILKLIQTQLVTTNLYARFR